MSRTGHTVDAGDAQVKRRPQRSDAVRLARRKYLSGERIEMGQLAAELGVSRVTLYRWVGTVDALLVEVIWALTELTLAQEWERAISMAGPRVPTVACNYLRQTMVQQGARRFAIEENERAMRILTLARYGYQPRLVDAVKNYLAADIAERRIHSSLPLDDLAYACVRIMESFYYLPTITGEQVDPDGAERVLTALLRP
ncbi:QsdR family transcriptional regulator [Lentzea sp. NPDC004782]|uniref:QsdR family transcriptional regulator n=1 Tax=Lentzea sp. NPDC004782 TaxID=3154458 RepID=UPI0033B694F8